MDIKYLIENSKLITEEINVANTDEIINAVIEQKQYTSLAYQIAEVTPMNSVEGGTFALKFVDDLANPGKKKVVLLRNNSIVEDDGIEDTGFTIEALQDLQRQYGKSAIKYVGKAFAGISAVNENIKLIQKLSATATVLPNLQADPNNAEFATFNIQQKASEVLLLINSKSFKSLDGFMILPEKWAASILGVSNLLPEQSTERGLYLGRNSRTKFYLNPDPTSTECFVGIHSEIPGQSSMIMSPYHHALKTAINPETGETHIFNFNRYAITENALSLSDASEKMIYKFEVDEVPMSVGGGGAVAVLDENGRVNAAACQLNFIGVDVIAKQSPVNPCGVDIYIPTPNYPSHYNTNDGTTNGFVSNTATSNRHVATPGTFDIGDWTGGSEHLTTRNNNLIFNNSADVLFETDDSDILVEVLGADDSTVIGTVSLTDVSGNASATNDNITLQVTNFGAANDKFKGRINVNIDIDAILPNSGRFSYIITHQQASGDWKKEEHNLFYDSEPNTAVLTGVTIDESAARITRFLSGVQYYDRLSPFTVDIADIDYLNGDSYPTIQTEVRGPEYGLPDLNLEGSDLTGWTNDWDDVDDTYHNDDWKITATNYRFIGDDANILGRTEDWTQGSDVLSPNKNILIDTWTSQSSELEEYFTDEDFRLTSSYTAWDSTQDLRTYDGNNTGLQVMGGVVKVPQALSATNNNNADFSTYQPLSNPDYSSSNGREYFREFTDVTNSVRGSAWMAIEGFTLQNLKDSHVELWVFIPGRMTSECYVHTNAEYDYGTMDGDDDPIRVNDSTTNNIHMSFGTYGLDSTHNVIQIRLKINDSTIEPSSIVVSW